MRKLISNPISNLISNPISNLPLYRAILMHIKNMIQYIKYTLS